MSQFNKSRGTGFGRSVPSAGSRAGFALITPVSRRQGGIVDHRERRELDIQRGELGV